MRKNLFLKRFWVRKIFKERKEKGEYHVLVKEAKLFDYELFFKMFRMLPPKFEELLKLVGSRLIRTRARREPIRSEERLFVTLRYLVTGDAFSTISASYRISEASVGRKVKETYCVIWERLLEEGYTKYPKTEAKWKIVAKDFEDYLHFPNLIPGEFVVIIQQTDCSLHRRTRKTPAAHPSFVFLPA